MAVECLYREERDVLEVDCLSRVFLSAVPLKEDAECCLGLGYRRCEHSLVLLPFLGVYLYVSAFKHLLFAHCRVLAEVEADVLLFLCTGSTCPYSEAVFLSFLDTLEEPVSDCHDLTEAAEKYAEEQEFWFIRENPYTSQEYAFKAGADWQKRKMMEGAVEGEICHNTGVDYLDYNIAKLDEYIFSRFKVGDKVRIIILPKEEEQ